MTGNCRYCAGLRSPCDCTEDCGTEDSPVGICGWAYGERMKGQPVETRRTTSCEDVYDGEDCTRRAAWFIQVGGRLTDAQTSCPQHLSRTCQVMIDAEGRQDVALTVTRIGTGRE